MVLPFGRAYRRIGAPRCRWFLPARNAPISHPPMGATHGGLRGQEGVLACPGDLGVVVGLDCAGFLRSCRISCRRAGRGHAGAPAAVAPCQGAGEDERA